MNGFREWLDTLFGADGGRAAQMVLALVVVVLLVIGLARLFRRLFSGTLLQRGRSSRLSVVDQTPIDQTRRLLLIRRDEVEHLVMIGGPNDLLVESRILHGVPTLSGRAAPAARPQPAPVPAAPIPAAPIPAAAVRSTPAAAAIGEAPARPADPVAPARSEPAPRPIVAAPPEPPVVAPAVPEAAAQIEPPAAPAAPEPERRGRGFLAAGAIATAAAGGIGALMRGDAGRRTEPAAPEPVVPPAPPVETAARLDAPLFVEPPAPAAPPIEAPVAETSVAEALVAEILAVESRPAEPRATETRPSETRAAEARTVEARTVEARAVETRHAEPAPIEPAVEFPEAPAPVEPPPRRSSFDFLSRPLRPRTPEAAPAPAPLSVPVEPQVPVPAPVQAALIDEPAEPTAERIERSALADEIERALGDLSEPVHPAPEPVPARHGAPRSLDDIDILADFDTIAAELLRGTGGGERERVEPPLEPVVETQPHAEDRRERHVEPTFEETIAAAVETAVVEPPAAAVEPAHGERTEPHFDFGLPPHDEKATPAWMHVSPEPMLEHAATVVAPNVPPAAPEEPVAEPEPVPETPAQAAEPPAPAAAPRSQIDELEEEMARLLAELSGQSRR